MRIPQIPASFVILKVRSGDYSLKLNKQSYDKHVPGNKTFDIYMASRSAKGLPPQSILTISIEEAQQIIYEKSGTGIIKVRRDGSPTNIEWITCNKIIGLYYNGNGYSITNKAAIHHGRRGSHIVPQKGANYD